MRIKINKILFKEENVEFKNKNTQIYKETNNKNNK